MRNSLCNYSFIHPSNALGIFCRHLHTHFGHFEFTIFSVKNLWDFGDLCFSFENAYWFWTSGLGVIYWNEFCEGNWKLDRKLCQLGFFFSWKPKNSTFSYSNPDRFWAFGLGMIDYWNGCVSSGNWEKLDDFDFLTELCWWGQWAFCGVAWPWPWFACCCCWIEFLFTGLSESSWGLSALPHSSFSFPFLIPFLPSLSPFSPFCLPAGHRLSVVFLLCSPFPHLQSSLPANIF